MSTLIRFLNQLLVATGFLPLTDFTGGSPWNSALPNPSTPPYGADPNLFSSGSNDQPWQPGTFNDADRSQGPQLLLYTAVAEGTGGYAGETSLDVADLVAFLAAGANNLATIAAGYAAWAAVIAAGPALPILAVDNDPIVTPPNNGYNS